jgi:hypothetical protein
MLKMFKGTVMFEKFATFRNYLTPLCPLLSLPHFLKGLTLSRKVPLRYFVQGTEPVKGLKIWGAIGDISTVFLNEQVLLISKKKLGGCPPATLVPTVLKAKPT